MAPSVFSFIEGSVQNGSRCSINVDLSRDPLSHPKLLSQGTNDVLQLQRFNSIKAGFNVLSVPVPVQFFLGSYLELKILVSRAVRLCPIFFLPCNLEENSPALFLDFYQTWIAASLLHPSIPTSRPRI